MSLRGPEVTPRTGAVDQQIASTAAAIVDSITKEPVVRTTSTKSSIQEVQPDVGHPREQFEVIEGDRPGVDEVVYPTGVKLWSTFASLCMIMYLQGVDITIVSVAVPSITDDFKTINDIGWYSAVYGLVLSCLMFFVGKLYTVYRTKWIYLTGIAIFWLGSVLSTFAQTSKAFIMGRVVLGLGASLFGGGMVKLLKDMFPLNKQALAIGMVGGSQALGLVSAPMIGGLLIGAFTWRGCFGINIPLGAACFAFTAWAFEEPNPVPDVGLPFKEKLKRLDLFSTLLVIPSIACLLMALQWGGIQYGWSDWRIIVLFVVFAVTFSAFGYLQYRLGDLACVPPRILKNRTVLGATLFCSCCNGTLAMTEYYMSIYFQGVRGFTPTKAGLLGLPMIAGMTAAGFMSSAIVNYIGYYSPSLFTTSVIAPIASGLLTTVDLDGSVVKPTALLGMLGVGIGFGIMVPTLAITTVLSSKDVSIGNAITGFGGGMGSALWICVSATMFQSRLTQEIKIHSPVTNVTTLENVGLSGIRNAVGEDTLRNVLTGYNQAVVQTLYLPLGLTILTLVGAITIERKSMKKKQS